jgi:LysM repeat protein
MRKIPLFIAAIAIAAILMIGSPAKAWGQQSYVVQPGDTLFGIAARFNVSVSELATINRVYDVNAIYVGQTLILPAPLPSGYTPNYPTNPQQPTYPTYPNNYNPQNPYQYPIYTPPVVTYPQGYTTTRYVSYIVRRGDILASIAARYKTTPEAILSANAIYNPNLLYVGQHLTIPILSKTTYTRPVKYQQPTYNPRPSYGGRVYIIQPGDNLFGISARFGRDIYSIARANGILNLNAIYVGMPLIIP